MTTRFGYDGLDLIAEYNGSNALLRRYVHGPGIDQPLVQYEGTGTTVRRFLSADERGSIAAVTDGSGNLFAANNYDEYGIPGSANYGRFQYTGQVWLPELGMYYYKNRIYSPTLGRFLQTDPIGYAGGINLYAYVGNDPVNFVDPLGLDPAPGEDGGEIVVTGTRCGGIWVGNFCLNSLDVASLIGGSNSGDGVGNLLGGIGDALDKFAEDHLKPPPPRQEGETKEDCMDRVAGDTPRDLAKAGAAAGAGANILPYPRAVPPGGSGTSIISTVSRGAFSGAPRMGSFKVMGTNSVGGAFGRLGSLGAVFYAAAQVGLVVGKTIGAEEVCK